MATPFEDSVKSIGVYHALEIKILGVAFSSK